jgi:hypothetical protein
MFSCVPVTLCCTYYKKPKILPKKKNLTEEQVLAGKLASDMFDFKKQVQVFTDNAAGAVARGAAMEKPSMPDTETSFVELIARVEKTREFILSIDPEKISDPANLQIKLGWMPTGKYFSAHTYLGDFVLQNALFHLTIAYAILRNMGANVGKMDYVGNVEMKGE